MKVREAIYERRAIRAYEPQVVDEKILRQLIEAAVHAPSAMNAQPWHFAVVQNRTILSRYSERAKAMMLEEMHGDPKASHYETRLRDGGFNIFYDAGTLVAIGAPRANRYADADCWLAAEAFMLAAFEAGLGTCPIGFAVPILNADDVKKELSFPAECAVIAPIIVGYPSMTVAPITRNPPRIVSWLR